MFTHYVICHEDTKTHREVFVKSFYSPGMFYSAKLVLTEDPSEAQLYPTARAAYERAAGESKLQHWKVRAI